MNRAMTGIRPTGELTIANYVGAMEPIVDMQEKFDGPVSIFVADLHGLTDQEPDVINKNRLTTARSLIAAGVDTDKTTIYLQSQIDGPTEGVASILDRHTTVAELMRVPTLKDKLRDDEGPEKATLSLFRYPVLMAADILVQDATHVPVGRDQEPHIEFARGVARKFNNQYASEDKPVFVIPQTVSAEGLKIMALNGEGKMSKSKPNGAIFLNDNPDAVAKKIKRAKAAGAGEMTEVLESHITLTRALCRTPEEVAVLNKLEERHMDGQGVMGEFKEFMTHKVNEFLAEFQERSGSISDREVILTLTEGGEKAAEQANSVHKRAKKAMGFVGLEGFGVRA